MFNINKAKIMKKIVRLFLATGVLFSMASCNLDQTPPSGELEGYTMEYADGLRANLYTNLTSLVSGSHLIFPDLYADVYNGMMQNGNNGQAVYNHQLNATSNEIQTLWGNYYAVIRNANYAIFHLKETLRLGDPEEIDEDAINRYIAEMQLGRAIAAHRVALLFCEDYCKTPDADKTTADAAAKEQLGLPYPTEYAPYESLGRGNLYDFYQQVLADIKAAEDMMTANASLYAGKQNAVYFTLDAVTAFRAQVALHTHDFANAATYASSLYGKYPLVTSKIELASMWFDTSSTENILQFTAIKGSNPIGDMMYILNGRWIPDTEEWECAPYYAPEEWIVNLIEPADYRTGVYVTDVNDTDFPSYILIGDRPKNYDGKLILKYKGTRGLESGMNRLAFRTYPKIFRIAEMYLIEAEAQYRLGGDAMTPITTLAAARNATPIGADDFTKIQNERSRELIGEGGRLYDIKRWNLDINRDFQTTLWAAYINQAWFELSEELPNTGFTFPIPVTELGGNKNPGMVQNPEFL